ncbi:hypothetical protein [Bifidobacterium pseudolongum]|uniref:hypothetical protein n=1 Tax=Bifidobacterium pseudolongum TaxID=1694 RepID=UPI00101FE8D2|nr:hypothetical protein [Bifidobacterium pseudolongum]RYQ44135.1 hypothetical protein PG1791B_1287 [Bifidobacterium pseudolongum subsp. globosum]
MAISYKARVCDTCGGTLRYDDTTGVYECIYCGNTYEKQAQYDGAFSVRFAAKQALITLLDVSLDANGTIANWNLVQDNLNDAQKIDPSYAGTIVAQLAASITRVRLLMGNREAVRTDLAQAQGAYLRLGTPFTPEANEEEADFYDQLDSPDVTAMLISVFGTFGDDARVQYLQQGFSAASINSSSAASDTLNRAFAQGSYEQIDELLQSSAPIDMQVLLPRLLAEYPDGDQKVANVATVIIRGAGGQPAMDAVSTYLCESQDAIDTRFAIASTAIGRGIVPNGQALAAIINDSNGDPRSTALLAQLPQGALSDEDTNAIVCTLLRAAGTPSATQGINGLAAAGYYLVFPEDAVVDMLLRTDLSAQDKTALVATLTHAGFSARRRQSLIAAYLEQRVPMQIKADTVRMLAQGLEGINPMTVESYLMHARVDGSDKTVMLQTLLAGVTARETVRMSARSYQRPGASPDSAEVTAANIQVLRQAGLA